MPSRQLLRSLSASGRVALIPPFSLFGAAKKNRNVARTGIPALIGKPTSVLWKTASLAAVTSSWRQLFKAGFAEVRIGRFQPLGVKARIEPCGIGFPKTVKLTFNLPPCFREIGGFGRCGVFCGILYRRPEGWKNSQLHLWNGGEYGERARHSGVRSGGLRVFRGCTQAPRRILRNARRLRAALRSCPRQLETRDR